MTVRIIFNDDDYCFYMYVRAIDVGANTVRIHTRSGYMIHPKCEIKSFEVK